MENANPFVPALPNGLSTKITQELNELHEVSAMIDSCLENINHTQIKIPSPVSVEQLFNNFMDSLNILEIDNLESDNESIDTPLVSPFLDSDDGSNDGELLNGLEEYGNEVVAYFDPFLLMNIIMRKAYNTIMVEGLESKGRNLVSIVRNVYVFVGSFTYVMDFVVLEDIREFIVSDMSEVVMGRPFRAVAQLEYDCVKGLISFTRIYDTYIFRMSRTIPRLKNFEWSKVPPILVLSQRDLMSRLKYSYEKNKLMYKNCLNLGPEYQVDENMK
ncbi:hypothetical protein Tco_0755862 [Tanacetum coccineum]